MDLGWLRKNVAHAFKVCPHWHDRLKMIEWTYASALPYRSDRGREWDIHFSFVPPVGDVVLRVRDNDGSDRFIFSEVFEHACYDVTLNSAPETVLDLGSNCGFAAVFFARKYPAASLACVEPIGENCRVLRNNIAINNLSAQVFEAAADPIDGTATMLMTKADYGSYVLRQAAQEGQTTQTCKSISVPSIMNRMKWKRIGLAKIDIEGHEQKLLTENAEWLADTDAIIIECHPGFGEKDLTAIAKRYGFLMPQEREGLWLLTRK